VLLQLCALAVITCAAVNASDVNAAAAMLFVQVRWAKLRGTPGSPQDKLTEAEREVGCRHVYDGCCSRAGVSLFRKFVGAHADELEYIYLKIFFG
jgi:hypothetical protein